MSLYLVLEGPDGSGKSVQAHSLCEWLRAQGQVTCHLREPGSTPVGEALRRVLLDPTSGDLAAVTEALLFSAARAQLLRDQIAPALASGRTVVVERCFVSTLVYQGLAPEERDRVPMDWLRTLTAQVHGDLWPDAIFLLDLDPQASAARSEGRDRIESRGAGFRARVRDGFLHVASSDPRIHVVDSSRSQGAVQDSLRQQVSVLVS